MNQPAISQPPRVLARGMKTSNPTRSRRAPQKEPSAPVTCSLLADTETRLTGSDGVSYKGGRIKTVDGEEHWRGMPVEEVKRPVVGVQYTVSAVRMVPSYNAGLFRRLSWMPVIGPEHEDEEHINFPWQHWHIDWRFVNANEYEKAVEWMTRRYPGQPWQVLALPIRRESICEEGRRIFTMKRRMPKHEGYVHWLPSLEKAYLGTRLKNCRVCPHRGLDLSSLPPDSRGLIHCPGHGLRFDAQTGVLVPH